MKGGRVLVGGTFGQEIMNTWPTHKQPNISSSLSGSTKATLRRATPLRRSTWRRSRSVLPGGDFYRHIWSKLAKLKPLWRFCRSPCQARARGSKSWSSSPRTTTECASPGTESSFPLPTPKRPLWERRASWDEKSTEHFKFYPCDPLLRVTMIIQGCLSGYTLHFVDIKLRVAFFV